jgi:hypothetical protein
MLTKFQSYKISLDGVLKKNFRVALYLSISLDGVLKKNFRVTKFRQRRLSPTASGRLLASD